jgi:hypothetical protein
LPALPLLLSLHLQLSCLLRFLLQEKAQHAAALNMLTKKQLKQLVDRRRGKLRVAALLRP